MAAAKDTAKTVDAFAADFLDLLGEGVGLLDVWPGYREAPLLGLAIVLLVIGFVAFLPTIAASVAGSSTASLAVGAIVSPIVTVFGIAATTRAYAQLKGMEPADPGEAGESEEVGALGPDDIPEP